MSEQIASKLVTYAVFLITISIIGISVISVIFPALIISTTYEFPINLEPFETSPWLLPIIISNVFLISFGLLFYKKKLPSRINNVIEFVLNFEISKKIAIISGIVILTIYIGLTIPELSINEIDQWPDFLVLKSALNIWPSTDHFSVYVKEQNTRYVRMALLDFSQDFFQNIKFLPFLASISVVILTALITIQITKKRFAGLIAMLVLLQSVTFTDFDTVAVYENFWVLFHLISLYSIQKRWWHSSPISFIVSIFTKAFIATYFWMNLFYIYRSEISKKTKFFLFGSYGAVLGITYMIFESGRSIIYDDIVRFDFIAFLEGFTGWGNSMQLDPFAILCILPITIGLFIKSLNGIKQSDSILFMLAGTILAGPLISLVTDFYFILPYRFIPFIIFMAIGVGIILSKKN
ncbi:MAG: hypothetical protein VX587_04390 [Thermoproteota archaeon]|nr:hypothetical protein [Thermoproteota archaeon]